MTPVPADQTTVSSVPAIMVGFLTANLPVVTDVITGCGRAYVLSRVYGRDSDHTFIDPIDGEVLVECKYFTDEPTARAWVASDIARRRAA